MGCMLMADFGFASILWSGCWEISGNYCFLWVHFGCSVYNKYALPCPSKKMLWYDCFKSSSGSINRKYNLVFGCCVVGWRATFQKRILRIAAIAAVYYKLGFGGYAGRMSYVFGFDDKNALYRNLVASFTVLNVIVALRLFNFKETYSLLSPIQTPVSILGSLVSNIGLLIISSLYYRYRDAMSHTCTTKCLDGSQFTIQLLCRDAVQNRWIDKHIPCFFVLYLWTNSPNCISKITGHLGC